MLNGDLRMIDKKYCTWFNVNDANGKNVVVLTPRTSGYQKLFDGYVGEGTAIIDEDGTAYAENELHVYVCEGYEKVKLK